MNTETRKVFDNMSIQQRAELLTISSSLQEQIDLMPLSRRVALIHFIKEINTNIDPEAADYQSLQPFVRRMALELSRALQFSTHDNEYFDKYYNSFEAFMAKDDEKKKKYSLKDYSRAKREQEKLRILGERRKYLDKLLGQERLRYASPENVALRDTIQPVIDVIQGQINIIDTQIDRMFEEE